MVLAILTFAYEWPLKYIAGSKIHTSLEARLLWLPLVCLSSVLLYQATNAALYYLIATGIYFWAFCEGEVSPSATFNSHGRLTKSLGYLRGTLDITKTSGPKTTA